jgi:hypothetical protein
MNDQLDGRTLTQQSACALRNAIVEVFKSDPSVRALGYRTYSALLIMAIAISADGSFGIPEEAELRRILSQEDSPLMILFREHQSDITVDAVIAMVRTRIQEENLLQEDSEYEVTPQEALEFSISKFLVLAEDVLQKDRALCALLFDVIVCITNADESVSPKEMEVLDTMEQVLTTVTAQS